MRDDRHMNAYRVVIVTLDRHAAGPAARVTPRLQADFPGITVDIFAAAEWGNNPAAFAECEAALREHAAARAKEMTRTAFRFQNGEPAVSAGCLLLQAAE
jgi:hypothetical protein